MVERGELVERLEKAEQSNALDIAVEIALFQPDDFHVAVRANSAGTKVIYTRFDGREETFWARDWSGLTPKTASALLKAGETG